MTNRYRSACCCDDVREGVCFLGYGGVPKTAYRPDRCHADAFDGEPTDDFNRHDNWDFCVHDQDEELVCVIERTKAKYSTTVAFLGGDPNCKCDCLGENESSSLLSYETDERPPIVCWYKQPFLSGNATDVPSTHIDELYYWTSYYREDLYVSPKIATDTFNRSDTWPCACPSHKYSGQVKCRSDFYCQQDIFPFCGWDINDNQLIWWPDNFGNLRYLTQSEIQFIGHPDGGTGDNAGWRTSAWGYVKGGPEEPCPTTEEGEIRVGFGVLEGGQQRMNSDFLYLQDIVSQGSPASTNGKPRLFKNYRTSILESAGTISVELDFGWGTCEDYPYGLWPLSFTFWGVMHREKWWQQYWNSISVNDVGDPSDPPPLGVDSDIYTGTFAERCRTPKYIRERCAGVPIFTHELVDKLDVDPGSWFPTDLKVYVPTTDGPRGLDPSSPAAYVMGCIQFGSKIDPIVTEKMVEVGILPDPINYGEEQDYRIFKKNFEFHDLEAQGGATGHCCNNVSDGGPLYCDCATEGAVFCGYTGDPIEVEIVLEDGSIITGISGSGCWDDLSPDGPNSDNDNDAIPGGVECSRFVCGYTGSFSATELAQWEDFFNDPDVIALNPGDSPEERLQDLRQFCDLDDWSETAIALARIATEYGFCGPSTLCFDSNKNICRNYAGGQHFEGSNCEETIEDPNILSCLQRREATEYDQGSIGSCCIEKIGLLQPGETEPELVPVHCLEISQELCNAFPEKNDGGNDPDSTAVKNWIDAVFGEVGLTPTPGAISEDQLEKVWVNYEDGEGNLVARCNSSEGCRSSFTALRNCEPVCDTDVNAEPNPNSFQCTGVYTPCEVDGPEDQYPCTPDQVGFTTDDYYFYGRPGQWSYVCGNAGQSDEAGTTEWDAFFPPKNSGLSPNQCSTDNCFSAAPYPTTYTSDPIPDGDKFCPDNSCKDLQGGGGEGCGSPVLSVCGGGQLADGEGEGDFSAGSKDIVNERSNLGACSDTNGSFTCFGAWIQQSSTALTWVGSQDDDCAKRTDYYCSNINNAFWLRMPQNVVHDDSYCKNYQVNYALHSIGEDDDGGIDENGDWTGETGSPAVLVYHNFVLADFIQFYGGCEHKILQGDSDSLLRNLIPGWPTDSETKLRWEIFDADTDQIFVTDPDDPNITVERNDGDPSSSSNPYIITINVQDRAFNVLNDLNIEWKIVDHDTGEPVDDLSEFISNANVLKRGHKIYVKTKTQNPGDVPNGLRDYEWYHAPIKRETPLPSAYWHITFPGDTSRDCWTGPPCCNTKTTQRYGASNKLCDYWTSDRTHGTPGGESECNYTRLPSSGEDLPDPLCGPCPENHYCCPTKNGVDGNCIPEGTFCCGCEADEVCLYNDESKSLQCTKEDETERRDFNPDHRGIYWINIASQGNIPADQPGGDENPIDYWKINRAPYDSEGRSILRKSNPNVTPGLADSDKDAVNYMVYQQFEPQYQLGYRRFIIRGPMGMRTGSPGGFGVPSAVWSSGDPNLETWNDKTNIGTVLNGGETFEYPFTSTGELASKDPEAVIGNMQQSYINFLKPWIQSKKDAGDPVDFYIYNAYQPCFFDDGTPARGAQALEVFYSSAGDWVNDRDTSEGTKWRDRYPLPDMSNPAHVEYFDGELDPWIDIGVTGFIVDASSFSSSGQPTGSVNPVNRPPGYFDYYRNKGVDVWGEAVPLENYGTDDGFGDEAALRDDLITETGFVGYYGGNSIEPYRDDDDGNFWRNRWTNIFLSPEDTEVHISLVWSFAGARNGFNGRYASGNQPLGTVPGCGFPELDGRCGYADVVYDIEGMKAEIDEMRDRGFVVSAAFNPYTGTTPVNEGPARDEIIDYITKPVTQSTVFGGGINSSARVPFHVLNGDAESMHFMISFQMAGPDDNDPEDVLDYINKTDDEIRQAFRNHINGFDDRGSTPGVLRSEYLNENTTGYVMFDLEKPLNYGNKNNTQFELTWFTQGLIRRIQIFREFCPNAKICVWRFGGTDFRAGYSAWPNGGLNNIDFNKLVEDSVFASKIEYNGQTLYDAIDVHTPVLYQYYAEGDEFGVGERILNGVRVQQLKAVRDRLFDVHGVNKPCIPIMKFEYIDIGVSDQNVNNGTNADVMNAPEIAKLLRDRVTNKIMFWLGGSWSDTSSFETKRDRLVDAINDIGVIPEDPTIIILDPRTGEPIDAPEQEEQPVTISQTIGETTFEWSFNVTPQESGTFVDGSPWVVFPAGSSPALIDVTPRPEINVVQETSFNPPEALTIYRNGFIVNPKLGPESNSVSDFIEGTEIPHTPLFADNRNNSVFSRQNSIEDLQNVLNDDFDIEGFTERKDSIENGSGILVNSDDMIVLSQSFYDENDDRPYSAGSSYLPFVGETLVYHDDNLSPVEEGQDAFVSARTAIKNQAVLTVLENAPANDSYRPPIYWPSGTSKPKPIFEYSLTRSVSTGSEIIEEHGHNKDVGLKNQYPWKERQYRDNILIGPILDAGSEVGASYSSAKALSNLTAYYYKDLNYGGNKTSPLLLGLFNHMTNTNFDEDERESVARRLVQYGIDEYGKSMCLTRTGGGAGQRAGIMKPWALFAMYMLGQDVRSMEELITEIYGDNFEGLSQGDKNEFLQRKFQEDWTVRQIYQDDTDTNIPEGERDADLRYLSNIDSTVVDSDKILGNCYNEVLDMTKFIRAETFELGIDGALNYSKAATKFEIPADTELEGGFGQLVFNGVPITYPGADRHSDNAVNLIGCRLVINDVDYTIIDMSLNMGGGEAGQMGDRFIVVDRPFETEITDSTIIKLRAFRQEDRGGYFYFREGATRRDPDRAVNDNTDYGCPSLHNDGYCQITWTANFGIYAFLLRAYKEIEDLEFPVIENKLGVWYKWYRTYLINTLGTTSLPRNWQFDHGRVSKLGVGAAANSFIWIEDYYTPTVLPGIEPDIEE